MYKIEMLILVAWFGATPAPLNVEPRPSPEFASLQTCLADLPNRVLDIRRDVLAKAILHRKVVRLLIYGWCRALGTPI